MTDHFKPSFTTAAAELEGASLLYAPFTFSDIPRIDPVEKDFWLDQLASETFKDKQGKNALQTPDGNFCCLGVYCEAKDMPKSTFPDMYTVPDIAPDTVTGVGTVRTRVKVELVHYGDGEKEDRQMATIPDGHHIPWAEGDMKGRFAWGSGFTGDEDLFLCQEQKSDGSLQLVKTWSLPRLNDEGFTFDQIADVIRYCL